MRIEEEHAEQICLLNKSFAQRLIEIVEGVNKNKPRHDFLRASIQPKEHTPGKAVYLHRVDNLQYTVYIQTEYDRNGALGDDFGTLPIDFELPAAAIRDFHGQDKDLIVVTTPYGILPNRAVIDADGNFYQFRNTYFFNVYGQAVKYESIHRRGLNPKDATPTKSYQRLDFTPKEEDSRLVKLKGGDYEKIGGILQLIENSEFTAFLSEGM